MGNVEVAWEDVISVINMMRAHLIIIAAVLIAMIVSYRITCNNGNQRTLINP